VYTTLLSVVARIHPQVWDAIYPHGPAIGVTEPVAGFASRLDRVALNPQPLPPREAFLLGAAELAHEIVRTALGIEARGDSSLSFVRDTIDDWCGTPWPHKWPLPWPGPHRGDGPHPEPWDAYDIQAGRIIGGIVFASIAERILDDKLSAVFADGAERLTEAALNGNGATLDRALTTRAARTTKTSGGSAKRSARR
jgi:hypothetical protein